MMSEDDIYELTNLIKESIFAYRKRRQHAEGKIDLNVPGCDPVFLMSVESCDEGEEIATKWLTRLDDML